MTPNLQPTPIDNILNTEDMLHHAAPLVTNNEEETLSNTTENVIVRKKQQNPTTIQDNIHQERAKLQKPNNSSTDFKTYKTTLKTSTLKTSTDLVIETNQIISPQHLI